MDGGGEHIRLSEAGFDLQRLPPGGRGHGLFIRGRYYLRTYQVKPVSSSTPRENRDPARYQVKQHPYGGSKSVVNKFILIKASVITDEAAHLAY